ncbi:MAG: arginase family protein [Candidatus Micrarchaeia archaeon]
MNTNNKSKKLVFPVSNSNFDTAKFIILGVKSDDGSVYRKGSRYAPESMREFLNKNEVAGVKINKNFSSFGIENKMLSSKVNDIGNVDISKLKIVVKKIEKNKKIPITIGGDHSITYKILSSINIRGSWGVAYFDAHPDLISSRGKYFGSVLNDISKLPGFDPKSSVIVGTRTPEAEEIKNIQKLGIEIVTPLEIENEGLKNTIKKINRILKNKTYISIDMDVLDPAFAPGVTEPEPAGINPNQLISISKSIANKGIFGFDIMEICPKYDLNSMTQFLGYRVMLEIIDECKN